MKGAVIFPQTPLSKVVAISHGSGPCRDIGIKPRSRHYEYYHPKSDAFQIAQPSPHACHVSSRTKNGSARSATPRAAVLTEATRGATETASMDERMNLLGTVACGPMAIAAMPV